ncbi:protein phosphatase 1 regulatory subunit 12A isoform X6 [Channa argus]|uniref:protein phosphatase 1 regulatory subunit 12A isoform X6 n=1 Tax=Channa argus TaxID=215402 RepID=UPI0035214F5E
MAATDHSRSEAAKQRRQDQLQRWLGSETDRTGPDTLETPSGSGTRRAKVRFAQGAVFMAACSAGDREEVAALLRQGADINHANIDGLTALHQACIDENAEMVQFLVESGSDVNRGDNEGWTPLHAAASCGFIQIAKYLIEHDAQVGAVNSEGELPLDVATEDAMERLLKAEIKKQGIDVDKARKEEERVMLQDAMAVLAGGGTHPTPHPNTKATALHVAAAKGYIEVLKVLLQCSMDVDSRDIDGWTPLHAAAHWGQEEVCTLLADHMCDMSAVNNVGQTPLDVADENLVDALEELQKKQNALRSEKEKQTPVIETSPQISMVPVRTRRTSISRMSSKEKICLHEREKHPPPALQSSPAEDEEEEGQTGQSQTQSQAKASSSSSSEEESESESDAESEKAKNREIINNLNNKRNTTSQLPTSMSSSTVASQVKKQEPSKPSTEAPGSWRTSLRKAGSSVTLGSAGLSDSSQDPTRPEDSGLGMTRSASSPRLSSDVDTKEPRLARVPPNPTRKLFSIPDSSPDNSNSASYGKRLDDPTMTSASTGTSSTGLSRLNNILAQRLPQEQTEKKDQSAVTTSNSQSTTTGEQETKQRRKSYLTPVRDEEAEAQRKARSRHARQSRRSTQGVTLTDLQEAEKTIKTMKVDNNGREEKEKEAKPKKGEEGEVSWRSRIASLQKSDLLGLTQPAGTPRPQPSDRREVEASTGESETERWARERRERRQARARRKAQRTGESDDNDPSGEEEFSGSGLNPKSDQHLSSRSDRSCNDPTQGGETGTKDFRKLFEEVSRENSQLQSQLHDTQRIVSQTRLDLEKATQRQERFTDCSALLELERKDRRMLERRMAELEEELKVLVDLRADNQRLKDENGALIRVISKLSK